MQVLKKIGTMMQWTTGILPATGLAKPDKPAESPAVKMPTTTRPFQIQHPGGFAKLFARIPPEQTRITLEQLGDQILSGVLSGQDLNEPEWQKFLRMAQLKDQTPSSDDRNTRLRCGLRADGLFYPMTLNDNLFMLIFGEDTNFKQLDELMMQTDLGTTIMTPYVFTKADGSKYMLVNSLSRADLPYTYHWDRSVYFIEDANRIWHWPDRKTKGLKQESKKLRERVIAASRFRLHQVIPVNKPPEFEIQEYLPDHKIRSILKASGLQKLLVNGSELSLGNPKTLLGFEFFPGNNPESQFSVLVATLLGTIFDWLEMPTHESGA